LLLSAAISGHALAKSAAELSNPIPIVVRLIMALFLSFLGEQFAPRGPFCKHASSVAIL
jgi:hypothetical protein